MEEENRESKITILVVDSGQMIDKTWIGMPYHPKGCRKRKRACGVDPTSYRDEEYAG